MTDDPSHAIPQPRDWPFPFDALLEPRRPGRAILVGWAMTTIPAILLSLIVSNLFPQAAGPTFEVAGWSTVLLLVIFAPLIETMIMAAVLELLLFAPRPRFALPPKYAVILSSLGWGVAHSLAAPAWGLIIWWPFLIFSILYVTWRSVDRVLAMAIVFAVHALNNLGPALLLLRSA